jgi:hypothetical protein
MISRSRVDVASQEATTDRMNSICHGTSVSLPPLCKENVRVRLTARAETTAHERRPSPISVRGHAWTVRRRGERPKGDPLPLSARSNALKHWKRSFSGPQAGSARRALIGRGQVLDAPRRPLTADVARQAEEQ